MKKALRILIIPAILVCSLLLATGCSLADLFKPQNPDGKSVSRIELTKDIKANYLVGDQLNLQDAKLRIVYSDESTSEIEITVTMLSGFDTSTIGSKTLTINYAEKTATYPYTVKYLIEMGTFYLTKIENYDLTTGNLVNTVTPNINGILQAI